ncbi:MAG: DUF485 domain-containing protein [Thermoleophilia bacterium]
MSERLRRNIPPSSGKERYGTWDLSSDRQTPEGQLDDAWEGRAAEQPVEQTDESVRRLIVRQRRLSIAATTVLLGTVAGVLIASHLYPDTMAEPVWRGFSPAFLFVGVVIYPLTWIVAALYVIISNRMDGLV